MTAADGWGVLTPGWAYTVPVHGGRNQPSVNRPS